ncbi:MAG: hypothetical protein MAG453_00318 [Calditrichaeota bacterium]|nr:hypothetical protein [Calditrichota bacterium]
MARRPPVFRTFLLIAAALAFASPRAVASDDPPGAVDVSPEKYRDKADVPWQFTFSTEGRFWFIWAAKRDRLVTWDYGAKILMEAGRGHGHRFWYGGEYRLAAGYLGSQSITPFDPSQVDSWLYAGWRWAWRDRRQVYIFLRRCCFHLIDRKYTDAVFWTHTAFGIGTTSPMEEGEQAIEVRKRGRAQLDLFLSTGPFIHGGPARLFGHNSTYQWESSAYAAWTVPVTRTFLLELSGRVDLLNTLPNDGKTIRWRSYARFYLIAQRDKGNASFYIDRVLHDDYIDRRVPVSWRFGTEHRF